MRKELAISFADLESVCITCQRCGTKVSLDLKKEAQRPTGAPFTPRRCPACDDLLDTATQNIDRFQEICRALSKVEPPVTIRVEVDAIP